MLTAKNVVNYHNFYEFFQILTYKKYYMTGNYTFLVFI